jgi:formamidase
VRTVPPRENGGNLDTKETVVGTTLLFPCFIDGCGLFAGDVHYAQGGGEVCGTAIEMGAEVKMRAAIMHGVAVVDYVFERGGQGEGFLSREQAYTARRSRRSPISPRTSASPRATRKSIMLSVAATLTTVDLNIAQLVDVPNLGVTAILNRDIFKP